MDAHKYEIIFSFILWIAAVGYAISGVIRTRKAFDYYEDVYGDFKQGWLITNTKKDTADYEWEITLQLLKQIYPWFIIHVVVSESLRQTYFFKILPYWQFILSLLCITYTTSIIGAIIITIQPIVFDFFSKFKNVLSVWCCSGICLLSICFLKSLNVTKEANLIGLSETQHYMVIVASCWINLRCISYCTDNINSKHRRLIDALSYCLYLPTLFLGPFMLYSNFEKSQKHYKVHLRMRVNQFLCSMIHFGLWFLFTEFALHYVYINALSFQPEIVQSLDNWSLYGYGYCMGQFFHLKYVILYGFSTSISRFEHMSPPATPKCIGRIHLYSDMWKYFDEGLYKFLTRYIYMPTLGSRTIKHKMFSSFLCFSFVFVWHGIYQHVFIWAALNYVGIFLENAFSHIVNIINQNNKLVANWKWKYRLSCIAASPLLAMSAVSNFYFFAGTQIGNIFVQRILRSSMLANLSLLFFLCCCCYVSTEVKKWEKNRENKNKYTKISST